LSDARRFARHGPAQFSEPAMAALDRAFFLLGAIAGAWLAVLMVRQLFVGGLGDLWLIVLLWLLLAYLLLPRIHTLLTLIYVPDYFIGRTRTYEGLLADPVNLAFLGTEEQLHHVMGRAGWTRADELGFRSGLRIVTSTLSRRSYDTAPVSPLFLFGAMQDFTYQQEVEGNPARRHHVRFWRTPPGWYLPGGRAVDWVAAGTYDRRVGVSIFTLQITHRISAAVDEERDHIAGTIDSANPDVTKTVIPHFFSGYHSRNGGGDAIRTDGDLPVLDVRRVAVEAADVSGAGSRTGAAAHHGGQTRALLETVQDTSASNRVKRPITLYVGYGLVLGRAALAAATSVVSLLGLFGAGRDWSAHTWWEGLPQTPGTVPLIVAGVLVGSLVYVGLGQLTFLGSAAARFLTLALSVAGAALDVFRGPPEPTGPGLQLWLITLALDVGILITMSSGDVRDFDVRTPVRRSRRSASGD
jgi:hypothetical protein